MRRYPQNSDHRIGSDASKENMAGKRQDSGRDGPQPLVLSERFGRAVDYARTLHVERRKGTGIPSMAHLLGVASLVVSQDGRVPFAVSEDMVVAAVLHDTVEDHGGAGRLNDLADHFGDAVARMVEGLSDSLGEDRNSKEPWEQRKRRYLARLAHESPEVRLICAADKLDNARAILDDYRRIGPEVWKRFARSRDLQLWYFRELLTIFARAGTNRIVAEFGRVVGELESLSADETRPARRGKGGGHGKDPLPT